VAEHNVPELEQFEGGDAMQRAPTIFGQHDEKTLAQLADVGSRAERVALMADGHLGYVMPIGGVAAYRNQVSVVGVGFDIACGNAAIQTDLLLANFDRVRLEQLADEIQRTISFGMGRNNRADDAPVNHALFGDAAWEAIPGGVERERLRQKARHQLGTVGSGNHYVDVLADEDGRLWVGVHFGSRGLGHTIASGFLALAQGEAWGTRVPEREALLDLALPIGDAYYSLMKLAGQYAYAGRYWVARKVVELLGGEEQALVHNHHNYAWREEHDGETFLVVRKGATPAFPGQFGFVGGSMGDDSVILRGSTDPAALPIQQAALFSTVHGAGRVMSRTEAAGKVKRRKIWSCGQRDCVGELPISAPLLPGGQHPLCPVCGSKTHRHQSGEIVRAGKVTAEMMAEWIGGKGVILRGGGLDESPHAYRRLPDVLAAQGSTVEVLHVLRPIIVVMAGADEFDPYKD
jgi:tRNA-splicing ligase RtcB